MTDVECPQCGSTERVTLVERLVAFHTIVSTDGDALYFERAEATHTSWDTRKVQPLGPIVFRVHCTWCEKDFDLPEGIRKAQAINE